MTQRPQDMIPFMLRRSRLSSLVIESFLFGEDSPPEQEEVTPWRAARAMQDLERVKLI